MMLVPFEHKDLGKSVSYYHGNYIVYVDSKTGRKFDIDVAGLFMVSNAYTCHPQNFTVREVEAILEVHKLLEKESQEKETNV